MSIWERQYQNAVADMTSPDFLDRKILQNAKKFRPSRQGGRWLSKAASSCATVAVFVLLFHPAQYLGALTPLGTPQTESLSRWQKPNDNLPKTDPWFELRSEVKAGNYINLCNQWRRRQRSGGLNKMPRDLNAKAQEHCRILPSS